MKITTKTVHSLLLLSLMALFGQCKDEATPAPNIVGKWTQQAYQYRIVYEVNGSRYDKTGTRTSVRSEPIEFKSDGTLTGDVDFGYTYTLSGDQITVKYGADVQTFKVSIIGDQLTVTGNENLIAGLSEADKIKEAKGWAVEVNGSSGGDGVYTSLSKATKAYEVYSTTIFQRAK